MKMKRKLLTFLAAVLLLSSLMGVVPALAYCETSEAEMTAYDTGTMRTEETKWYFRIYGDKLQMRLWSITYGYWKTDWIDC